MGCGFLEVVRCALKVCCVHVHVLKKRKKEIKIWHWLTISTHFSMQRRIYPPQFYISVSAEPFVALFFPLCPHSVVFLLQLYQYPQLLDEGIKGQLQVISLLKKIIC